MTWFGIIVAVWWILNIASAFYIIGKGGVETTPGSAVLSIIFITLLLIGLFTVGTGVM